MGSEGMAPGKGGFAFLCVVGRHPCRIGGGTLSVPAVGGPPRRGESVLPPTPSRGVEGSRHALGAGPRKERVPTTLVSELDLDEYGILFNSFTKLD